MSDFTVREYRPGDIARLTAIWAQVFEDTEKLIGDFFRLLPDMGSGVVAEKDGEVFGAAYIITGLSLYPGGEKCAYLYAVAVDENFRGLGAGRALSAAAADLGRKLGADIICTLPAEESLYAWYKDILGVECALCRDKRETESRALLPVRKIDADEYGCLREKLLESENRLVPSSAVLEFQKCLCEEYEGGLFAVGSGIAAAYSSENICHVKEVICADEAERESIAASVGAFLGREDTMLHFPSAEGDMYLAAEPGRIPADCVWNLSFD